MSKKAKKYRGPKAKITFRHNILPPALGLLMFGGVMGLMNSQWIIAQAQYRYSPKVSAAAIDAEMYAQAPKGSVQLSIPSISVNAPVVYEPSMAEWKIQIALRSGPDHLGSSALPGQKGNVVIVGHSSGQLWAPGNYKFVFTLLDRVEPTNLIFLDYNGVRYIYRVTSTEVINPSNFSVIQPTADLELTLITCTPVGTSKNRFVVHAHQISPNPNTATTGANSNQKTSLKNLPQ
jgi:LPXTG-site transpeptidase (sortase) family protein